MATTTPPITGVPHHHGHGHGHGQPPPSINEFLDSKRDDTVRHGHGNAAAPSSHASFSATSSSNPDRLLGHHQRAAATRAAIESHSEAGELGQGILSLASQYAATSEELSTVRHSVAMAKGQVHHMKRTLSVGALRQQQLR